MSKNFSPWIYHLNKNRKRNILKCDTNVDVSIIGAGIAGISTAFFVLKYTDKNVSIFEAGKMAHGATGHNAGQITSYFEKGFAYLVETFGIDLASKGQKDIEDAWNLIDEMYTDGNLDINLSRFVGHLGLSSKEQVLLHLKNNYLRKQSGLNIEKIAISNSVDFINELPNEYKDLYSVISKKEVDALLETNIKDFVAVISYQKGCMNSALFCEQIVDYLLEKYPDRFSLYEHTPVNKVVLKKDFALLDAGKCAVETKKIVLCTNGFENINIINEGGLDINTKYHYLVSGKIGYMAGYLESMDKGPMAISYFTDKSADNDASYFYLTRRQYEYEKGIKHNLISIGGPDKDLEECEKYSFEDDYPDDMNEMINDFIKKNNDLYHDKKVDYVFNWHGLMGYTKNGVRMIGPEPKNNILLYNLGCNGVGILPSIHGGRKISKFISGEDLEKSIFDIPE